MFFWVALAVEQDEAPRPFDIGQLGADAVVAHPDGLADLLKKRAFRHGCCWAQNTVYVYSLKDLSREINLFAMLRRLPYISG
jgi:hypothetical protein